MDQPGLITSLRYFREDKKAEGCFLMKFLFSKISYEDDIFTHDLGLTKETKGVFFMLFKNLWVLGSCLIADAEIIYIMM